MAHIFVYGTLRQGGLHWQTYLAPSVGAAAATQAAFTMRSLGRFPVVEAVGNTSITGEVFVVSDETLAAIDRLEGHPDWYERVEIDVMCCSQARQAWIYLMTPGTHDDAPIIASGDWSLR